LNRLLLLILAGCVGLSACSKKEEVASAIAPPSAAAAAAPNSGKILQIQQSGSYTYAEVEGSGGKVWIAGGPLSAKPGDIVQWGDYAMMKNFHSKTLDRDFAEILFVNSWGPQGAIPAQVAPHGGMPAQAAPHGAMAGGMPGAMPSAMPAGHPAVASTAPMAQPAAGGSEQGSVKSVTVAAGYTYLEVDQGGSVVWVAAPETPIKAGDKVRWGPGPVMQNFTSKSLGRTFDSIVFASQVEVVR
jgi:hypothetical protein